MEVYGVPARLTQRCYVNEVPVSPIKRHVSGEEGVRTG